MLDAVLRRHAEPYAASLADRLAALRVRSVGLTLAGFLCAIGAAVDIAHGHTWLGLGLLAAGGILNALGGPLARREGATAGRDYLGVVLGLTADGLIPFAFALADPGRALAAMFLMLGLTVRAAAAVGAARSSGWTGAMLELAGIGRTELFIALAIACVFPDRFSIVAYTIGILCFIGAGSRVAAVMAERP